MPGAAKGKIMYQVFFDHGFNNIGENITGITDATKERIEKIVRDAGALDAEFMKTRETAMRIRRESSQIYDIKTGAFVKNKKMSRFAIYVYGGDSVERHLEVANAIKAGLQELFAKKSK